MKGQRASLCRCGVIDGNECKHAQVALSQDITSPKCHKGTLLLCDLTVPGTFCPSPHFFILFFFMADEMEGGRGGIGSIFNA
jgi:hypothetical protein